MTLSNLHENANDLLHVIVSSYHVLIDKLDIGRTRSRDWFALLEDVAGATAFDAKTRSQDRDPEALADLFWIDELDPRADRVLTSKEPLAADLFYASLVVLVIDEYRKIITSVHPTIDHLHEAATRVVAQDFSIDLAQRPSPEPEIAIACAREVAGAWVRWVHRP